MSIKIDLPEDIQLKIKIDKNIEKIIKKRIERELSEKIKEDIFLSMLFDKVLENSKLEEEDVDKIEIEMLPFLFRNYLFSILLITFNF